MYYIVFIVGSLGTVFTWDYRFDINLYLSSFFNLVGGFIRYFAFQSYNWMMFGTFIICVA